MPEKTRPDPNIRKCRLSPRASQLRDAYFKALPEICIERPHLITGYSLKHGLFEKERISILDKAKMYRHVLEKRTAVVRHTGSRMKGMKPFSFKDRQLFPGSTTSKFKGVPLYPEFLALTLWPELWSISDRESNPLFLSEHDAKELNANIFPHWMEATILELARKRAKEEDRRDILHQIRMLQKLVFFMASKAQCISHTIPDFRRPVRDGLRAMIHDAGKRCSRAPEKEKREFYEAVGEVLEGILAYAARLSEAAQNLADQSNDPDEKEELRTMADICKKVPAARAESFREGLTTVWICWTAIHLENPNIGLSLGRLDQLLHDLYRRDIDSGAMSIEEAVELVCCFWLKIGDHVPAIPVAGEKLFGGSGSNQAITLGGVDEDGNDAVNELTYVMLRATELMKLRDPNLNARYHPGVNSDDYLKRLCQVNIETAATPAIHNDRAVVAALQDKGDSLSQARDYGIVGCVEPCSNGRCYGHSAAILLNLTSVLELTLFNGRHRHTGTDPEDLISFESSPPRTYRDFQALFTKQLKWMVDRTVALNNFFGKIHQDFYPTPILSSFFEGPVETGTDLIQGGATINASGATIIGLADVADSISALKKHVFSSIRTVSYEDLLQSLQTDFEDNLALQTRLSNPGRTPKYGNDDDEVDEIVTWIVKTLDSQFRAKENYRGGRYRVGYWTMTKHAGFGRLMGAMPSGRRAGANFTSGITPVSGVTPDLCSALRSVAKQPVGCLSGGVALNLKYMPEPNQKQMLENFAASVKAYFEGTGTNPEGGMEIQFNIMDREMLKDAVAHPDQYDELLVRVSGYTAYFKDLNPQMQQEIIERTQYRLSNGQMVP